MAANYKPSEWQNVIPYLMVPDADTELKFMKEVFRGKQAHVYRCPEGRIRHAEVGIGDSIIMLGQASEQWPALPAAIYVYLPDVDAAYQRALTQGVTSIQPPADQPFGDRNCGVIDANGVQWWIATHIKDVSEAEMQACTAQAGKSASTL